MARPSKNQKKMLVSAIGLPVPGTGMWPLYDFTPGVVSQMWF